jgi:hypothetical protein
MNIQHEIISFHPPTGSLLVRYFSNEVPDGLTYNIDVPLVDGEFVSQDQIDALIVAMQPIGQLERLYLLQTVKVPDALAALVPAPVLDPVVSQTQPVIIGTDTPPVV